MGYVSTVLRRSRRNRCVISVVSVVSHWVAAGVWFGLAVFVIVMVSSLVTYGRYLSCGLVAAKSFVFPR